jgi:integrase
MEAHSKKKATKRESEASRKSAAKKKIRRKRKVIRRVTTNQGPVKLRRRALSDGRISLHLETYVKGKRTTEFLRLYLQPSTRGYDPSNNLRVLGQAEQIRAQRIKALCPDTKPNDYVTSVPLASGNFTEFFRNCMQERLDSKGNYGSWDGAYKHLQVYTQEKDLTFAQIDFMFLIGFKKYLLKAYHLKSGAHKLKQNTAYAYLNKIRVALTLAFEQGIIQKDVGKKVSIPEAETVREVLSWEEVNRLLDAECESYTLKRAFFFCLLTGLRFSDVVSITWSELLGNATEGWYLKFRIKKNGRPEHLPITQYAKNILGDEQPLEQKLFPDLKYSTWVTTALVRWMANAKIFRKITFHAARHFHATFLLDQGVDIFIVSKLLGHKFVSTTQLYTKVSVTNRRKALANIPDLDTRKLVPTAAPLSPSNMSSNDTDNWLPEGPKSTKEVSLFTKTTYTWTVKNSDGNEYGAEWADGLP